MLQREKVDFKKAAERLIKKYLDENLRMLKNQHNSTKDVSKTEDESNCIEDNLKRDIKDTISRIAQSEAEREIMEHKAQEDQYDSEMIQSLIIEYGMLLEQNNIDIEQFSNLDSEKQYALINNLKNEKQAIEFSKLSQKANNLDEFSKFSIKTYIEAVQEKHKLKSYRIKASNEYIKMKNIEEKSKKLVYNSGVDPQDKPKLPDVFNKPLKKRKKKVDQMIMDMDRENQEEIRKIKNSNSSLNNVELIMLNPVDMFEKLNYINKSKDLIDSKTKHQNEAKLKEIQKDEEDALWNDDDSNSQHKDLNIVVESDSDDPFKEDIDDSQINNSNIKAIESELNKRLLNSFDQEDDSIDSISNKIEAKRISSPTKHSKLIPQENDKDKEIHDLDENTVITFNNPVNDYYVNKNKLQRIFQNKSKNRIKDNESASNQFSIQLGSTTADLNHSDIGVKKNSMEVDKRQSNFTQVSNNSISSLPEPFNRVSWDSDQPKKRIEEDKYADYNQNKRNKESISTEDKTKDENEEIFHDFDQQSNQDYDIEEIKECMEINKLNSIKIIEQNDQDFTLFSEEMYSDIKKLLYLFGIPYIDAPFEAESQWAYLELSGKADGVVTQDSDVFLFGSRNVYKDIFDQNKFVEYYNMNIIESELGFDRDSLVWMALLLGSDYTIGVRGIGPVNATEAVQAFPTVHSLERFKEWADKGTFQSYEEIKQEVENYHSNERTDDASKKIRDYEMKSELIYELQIINCI